MRMKKLPYRSHNTAYFDWIDKQIGDRRRILDVGCGDGSLIYRLAADSREVTGLDPSEACVTAARRLCADCEGVRFRCETFADADLPEGAFDAVVFSASLHHMEQNGALRKAVSLLREDGVLLVVGLAAPSRFSDYVREGLRVVPSLVVSKLSGMKKTEEAGVPVSYALPPMDEVRETMRTVLPGSRLRHGLHFRYLLRYEKKTMPSE